MLFVPRVFRVRIESGITLMGVRGRRERTWSVLKEERRDDFVFARCVVESMFFGGAGFGVLAGGVMKAHGLDRPPAFRAKRRILPGPCAILALVAARADWLSGSF